MRFSIAVHGSPYGSAAHQHALGFCQAALDAGHEIARVFFYHDGVYVGLDTRVVPADELDVTSAWQALSARSGFELSLCIATGLKRGVIDDDGAARNDKHHGSTADGFSVVGLGQLIDAIASSDRYIEFPA